MPQFLKERQGHGGKYEGTQVIGVEAHEYAVGIFVQGSSEKSSVVD